ncbi:MAG: hypothetical protein V2I97_16705 [Desulfococcaceae bacterium]|jgi:hypothetical protein|nr:hypothetical protein [Desulfococcaceae bacterium]
MKKFRLILLLLFAAGCTRYVPEKISSPPALSVARQHYEFEPLREGDVVSHDFLVKNTGGRDLILRRVSEG